MSLQDQAQLLDDSFDQHATATSDPIVDGQHSGTTDDPNQHAQPRKSGKNYQRLRSLDGILQFKDSEIKRRDDVIDDLRSQVTQMGDQLRGLVAQKDQERFAADTALSATEQQTYGEALPVVEKVAKRMMAQQSKAYEDRIAKLEERLAEQSKGITAVASNVQRTRDDDFIGAVQARVADINNLLQSDGWDDFLDQTVSEFATSTFRDELQRAIRTKNVDGVVRIASAYKTGSTYNGPQATTASAVPSPTAARRSFSPAGGHSVRLKYSERKKASQDFLSKRISPEKFAEIRTMYDKAATEGRVDYSA